MELDRRHLGRLPADVPGPLSSPPSGSGEEEEAGWALQIWGLALCTLYATRTRVWVSHQEGHSLQPLQPPTSHGKTQTPQCSVRGI